MSSSLIVSPRLTLLAAHPSIIFILILAAKSSLQECGGMALKPEVVESTAYNSYYPASSVPILGEEDERMDTGNFNFWVAEEYKTTGQGFTLKLDACARMIAGCKIKNTGKGFSGGATKNFKISGSKKKNGPWETLVEDQLEDTSGYNEAASLLNFTFEKPVEIQFIKFDLISYWGKYGGALQYFAAIPSTSGPAAETTTDSAIGTTIVKVTNSGCASQICNFSLLFIALSVIKVFNASRE